MAGEKSEEKGHDDHRKLDTIGGRRECPLIIHRCTSVVRSVVPVFSPRPFPCVHPFIELNFLAVSQIGVRFVLCFVWFGQEAQTAAAAVITPKK